MIDTLQNKKENKGLKGRFFFIMLLSLFPIITLTFLDFQVLSRGLSTEQLFIDVTINGQNIVTDTSPYIKDNRVFLSLRSISDALQIDLLWIQEENKVTLTLKDTTIELFTEESLRNIALINGENYIMDTPLEIVNNRTMVPARFISEHMGFHVEWDGFSFTLLLTMDDWVVDETFIVPKSYSSEDFLWLSRIVHVETGGIAIDNKLAVANVVLNRVNHKDYPSTIYDVIFDRKWSVQFPPAFRSGFEELIPSHESRIASKMALEGINNVVGCLWFNSKPFNNSNITFYKKIGGNYFYY
jgi:hypothetical protein